MKNRALLPHLSTLDSDPTSEVSQRKKEYFEEERDEKIVELKQPGFFKIGENEESKLLRKFLDNWKVYFNKSVARGGSALENKKRK